MSRKLVAVFAIAIVGGCVVALVHAQDFGGTLTPTEPPLLAQNTASGAPGETSSRRTARGSLADRLQSLRNSITNEYNGVEPEQNSQPTAPATNTFRPATPQPMTPQAIPSPQPAFTPPPTTPTPTTSTPATQPAATPLASEPSAFRSRYGGSFPVSDSGETFSSRRTASLPKTERLAAEPSEEVPVGPGPLFVSAAPKLVVYAKGPQDIVMGKPANYTITLENQASDEAGNVVISAAIPPGVNIEGLTASTGSPQAEADENGLTRIIWQIDRVPANGQYQLSFALAAQSNRPFEMTVEWAMRPEPTVQRISVLQPQLEMALKGAKEVLFGQSQRYSIVLSNPGTGVAENVTLSLAPIGLGQGASEAQRVGSIGPGESKEFPIELAARQAGALEIRASATADGGLKANLAEQIIVRRAELKVAIAGPRLQYAPSTAIYQIQLNNNGDAKASNMAVAVTLPRGAKYVSGVDGAQPFEGGVRLPIRELGVGAKQSFAIECELTAEGRNQFQVQVSADGEVSHSAVAETQVDTIADLRLTVTDPKGPVPVGENAQYDIVIVNRGTKAARGVVVTTQFAEGIEPVSAEGGRAQVGNGQVAFEAIGRIDIGQEVKLRVIARAQTAGNHLFRTELKCQEPDARQVWEDTTRFFGQSGDNAAPAEAEGPALFGSRPSASPIFPR